MRFRPRADPRSLLRTAVGAVMFAASIASCGSCGASSSAPAPTGTPATTSTTPSAPFTTSTGTSTTTTSTAPNSGVYTVHVSVTGTDNVQGTFTETLTVNANAPARCPVPSDLAGDVGSSHVELQMPITGNADGQPHPLSPGDLQLLIGSHTWAVASASNAPQGTSGTLRRNTDGSGAAMFQNLALQSDPSTQPQESGSITWTCA